MHSDRCDATERQGDGQHLESKLIHLGNCITGWNLGKKEGQASVNGPGGPQIGGLRNLQQL